jgi:myo-inositol-1(or 4)-monophosphatase
MPNQYDAQMALAIAAAEQTGALLLQYFGRAAIQEKSTQNLVTEADFAAERLISQRILDRFPGHAILREESAMVGGMQDEDLWIVDPLDGTNNYAHQIPHFCVSIAYAHRGDLKVGVVYDPVRPELFVAQRGCGASLNGKPIHVADTTELYRSIIATGFYYDRGESIDRTLDALKKLFQQNIRGMRRMGAAALDLAWVACGRMQGFFEYRLAPWDLAAGALLVEEAGGRCLDRTGQPLDLMSGSVIAACPGVMPALCEAVRWR